MKKREIELKGHIIDSLILPKVFGTIMDMGGNFTVKEFRIGRKKTERSYARILVEARSETQLNSIIEELQKLGAVAPEVKDARLLPAPADGVLPDGFYSTTNHRTYVMHRGKWLEVGDIKMDSVIVIEAGRAICKRAGEVRRGELVVVGSEGIRVELPERPRGAEIFEFMGSRVSTEKPSSTLIKRVADAIRTIKRRGGRIAVVAGPAIVHTGASPALAELIRNGYVDVLISGNALAAHDIEYQLLGTSLGMDVRTGELHEGGHRHHMLAINEVRKLGSIRAAVEKGVLKGGIMYECVINKVPYVLAGSIRDDGPLPDVITDVFEAQDRMREALRGIDLVLMMATMLHSIAAGNLLPSHVRTICVDISPQAVTKLMDRGTAHALGVVTDVGTFLPALAAELRK
jgi:lysine-ketoglutarate reductase/saccharopine dehydrogenase-like protein (TIGR00300 family)